MTAMTLLRAMSAIDPKDIEAAYRAKGVRMTSAAFSPVLTTEEAETPELYPARRSLIRKKAPRLAEADRGAFLQ